MWLAHYFPGLTLSIADVGQMTVEETIALQRAGRRILKGEAAERLAHTRVIATAAGMRF